MAFYIMYNVVDFVKYLIDTDNQNSILGSIVDTEQAIISSYTGSLEIKDGNEAEERLYNACKKYYPDCDIKRKVRVNTYDANGKRKRGEIDLLISKKNDGNYEVIEIKAHDNHAEKTDESECRTIIDYSQKIGGNSIPAIYFICDDKHKTQKYYEDRGVTVYYGSDFFDDLPNKEVVYKEVWDRSKKIHIEVNLDEKYKENVETIIRHYSKLIREKEKITNKKEKVHKISSEEKELHRILQLPNTILDVISPNRLFINELESQLGLANKLFE